MGWIFLIVAVIIIGAIWNVSNNGELKKKSINEIQVWMNENGFTKTSEFSYFDLSMGGYTIYIDESNKKLLILNLLTKAKCLIMFKDIIGMEVIEDGIRGNGVGRAVVGGILFGGVGAIVGANTSKKVVKNMSAIIYMNNISNPQIELILNKENIKTDSSIYKNKMDFARRLDATIRAIIANNENESSSQTEISSNKPLIEDVVDNSADFFVMYKVESSRLGKKDGQKQWCINGRANKEYFNEGESVDIYNGEMKLLKTLVVDEFIILSQVLGFSNEVQRQLAVDRVVLVFKGVDDVTLKEAKYVFGSGQFISKERCNDMAINMLTKTGKI